MCGGAVSWYSRKQRIVALSTVEAEYISLSFASQEAIWFRALVGEIEGLEKVKIKLYCDNKGAISLAKDHRVNQRTKHIDIRYHCIRDTIEREEIDVEYIETENMLAVIFTKATPRPRLNMCVKLGLDIK